MSIESITEKLKEENEIDQLDKTVESIKISIFKIITEWKDITKSVHTNIKLSLKITKLEDKYIFNTIGGRRGSKKKKHAKKKEKENSSSLLSMFLLLLAPMIIGLLAFITNKIKLFLSSAIDIFSSIGSSISSAFSSAMSAISSAVSSFSKPAGEDKEPKVLEFSDSEEYNFIANEPVLPDKPLSKNQMIALDMQESLGNTIPEYVKERYEKQKTEDKIKPGAAGSSDKVDVVPLPTNKRDDTKKAANITSIDATALSKDKMSSKKKKKDDIKSRSAAASIKETSSTKKTETPQNKKSSIAEPGLNKTVSVSQNAGKGSVANNTPPKDEPKSFLSSIKSFVSGAASAVASVVSGGYQRFVKAFVGKADATGPFVGKADATGLYIKPGISLEGTDPKLLSIIREVQNKTGKKLLITSGKRPLGSYGGGPLNPHVVGRGVDISVKSLNDADQQEVSRVAVSIGVTGLGAEGDHLHFDTSHITPMTWGADYRYASAPQWAKNLIKVGVLNAQFPQEGDGPAQPKTPSPQSAPQQQQQKKANSNSIKSPENSGDTEWYHSIERHFGVDQPATGTVQRT